MIRRQDNALMWIVQPADQGRGGARPCRWRAGVWMVVGLLLAPVVTRGEVDVTIRLEHPSTLQFESIYAFITLENNSLNPLIVEKDPKQSTMKLSFVVLRGRNTLIRKTKEGPILSPIRIGAYGKQELLVDVAEWYDFRTPGRYFVTAVVDKKGKTDMSNQSMIDIVNGIKITSQSRSVPGFEDLVRTYSLRYWARDKKEYLFLRIDEPSTGLNYGVYNLGTLVRVRKPTIHVDRLGHVKVVHQSGIDRYTHSTFNSMKTRVVPVDQTYHLADGERYPSYRRPQEGRPEVAEQPKRPESRKDVPKNKKKD